MKIKHVIGLVLIVSLLAFKSWEEKKYKVEFTENEWQARYQWIEVAKAHLKKSDLPAKDVLFISDSLLGRFQNELAIQLQPQFATKDSTKKKK